MLACGMVTSDHTASFSAYKGVLRPLSARCSQIGRISVLWRAGWSSTHLLDGSVAGFGCFVQYLARPCALTFRKVALEDVESRHCCGYIAWHYPSLSLNRPTRLPQCFHPSS